MVGVAFLLLLQVSRAAAIGYQVQQLQQTKSDLERQTYLLEAEMASLQSLDRIEREARTRLKMQPALRYLFVTVDQPSREGEQPPVGETPAHPWWGSILVSLGMRGD